MNVKEEIKKCREEIRLLEHILVDYKHQREEWLSGERSMYEDYPVWNSYFHRTPMDWINYEIEMIPNRIKRKRERLEWLYREKRVWYETEYFKQFSDDDIEKSIKKDGYIICVKL